MIRANASLPPRNHSLLQHRQWSCQQPRLDVQITSVSMIKDHRQHYSPRPRVLKQPLEVGEFCRRGGKTVPTSCCHRDAVSCMIRPIHSTLSGSLEFGWSDVSDMTPFLKLRRKSQEARVRLVTQMRLNGTQICKQIVIHFHECQEARQNPVFCFTTASPRHHHRYWSREAGRPLPSPRIT